MNKAFRTIAGAGIAAATMAPGLGPAAKTATNVSTRIAEFWLRGRAFGGVTDKVADTLTRTLNPSG